MKSKKIKPTEHVFNRLEQECIVLYTVWNMIDEMVNYSIFHNNHNIKEAQLNYRSIEGRTLFNILLSEFLSQPRGSFNLPQSSAKGDSNDTFLLYLRLICDNPKIGSTTDGLREATKNFADWLDEDCFVKDVWFPAINVKTDIRIKRILFLKICGDYAKHSLTRLGLNVKRIIAVLADNGVEIDRTQGFLVMEQFYDWFSNDQLAYHTTAIAELLNEIRWEIYEYLQQEFSRSFQRNDNDELMYSFDVPGDCKNELARAAYWELMNKARSLPWFPQFETISYLKTKF